MVFISSLESSVKVKNSELDNPYKVWTYKDTTVVLDINKDFINIALDITNQEGRVQLFVFGRDFFSSVLLEKILIPKNNWCNETFENKILFKEWSLNDNFEDITLYLFNLANDVYKQLQELEVKEITAVLESINDELLLNIKRKIKEGNSLNIGFLVSERQKWNCQTLWDELTKHPQINCKIYLQIASSDQLNDQLAFFQKIDPELVCLYNSRTKRNQRIKNYGLDLIFCQQSWTGLSRQIRGVIGKALTLYMHYGFLVYANSKMQYQQWDFHPFIWRYLSQSELQKKIHLEHDPSISGRQVITGYPKLDVYLDPAKKCDIWPEDNLKAKIIYAPHHALRKSALKISTFSWNFNLLLELSKKYKDFTQWAYKPHGRLKYAVVENNVMSGQEYTAYVQKWATQDNTVVYDDGNYFDLFRSSDVLITDCGSFLGEYFPTGKPIIWLMSDSANVELNAIGEKLSNGFYKVRSKSDLVNIFDDVVIQGNDPLKEYRKEVIKEIFPLKEKATTSIINYLMNTFEINTRA